MGSNYKVTYGVDLVFCIDVTMSMAHILDTVKQNALRFYSLNFRGRQRISGPVWRASNPWEAETIRRMAWRHWHMR